MAEPELIVMAAGIGSRYGGLKQIEPMGCCIWSTRAKAVPAAVVTIMVSRTGK